MAKFVRLNGIVPASLIDADDTTTRYICLRSKIQDSLTRQLHKHQFDQKIIQGYSRIKSIYNMRWRHKSSSIVISIFFSRVSRIGQKTYGFTSCVQKYLKTIQNLQTLLQTMIIFNKNHIHANISISL